MEINIIYKTTLKPEELENLEFLEKKGSCLYGNIFKELHLSHTKGAELIYSLLIKGYIHSIGSTSYYELNGKLEE